MEFSYNYKTIMYNLICPSSIGVHTRINLTLERGYPAFLVVNNLQQPDLRNFLIPLAASNEVLNFLRNYSPQDQNNRIDSLAFPLNIDNTIKTCSSPEGILKYFATLPLYRTRLAKVLTSKGEVYYGKPGLIFDKHLNPLFVATANIDFVKFARGEIPFIKELIIHVHPNVFTDDSGVINRNLLKKGIPYILSDQFKMNLPSSMDSNIPIRVVIDDSSEFIRKPSPPGDDLDTDINNLLKNNIDEVLAQFV